MRLGESKQLIPGHKPVSGRTGMEIQVCSSPIPVFPLPHRIGTIVPHCLTQDKIPTENLSGAQLTFLSSSPRNTGMFLNWEWWLPGQGPEQRIVSAEILNQTRARNSVETWQIFAEDLSEYKIQDEDFLYVTKEGSELREAKWLALHQQRPRKDLSFSGERWKKNQRCLDFQTKDLPAISP